MSTAGTAMRRILGAGVYVAVAKAAVVTRFTCGTVIRDGLAIP